MEGNKKISIIRLDDLAAIKITGEDATKFLHAQFTNDLANLPVLNWQYTGYCTPKGRLLAFITIARTGEKEYLLVVPEEISAAFIKRLSMFVMRDDVSISAEQDISLSGIIGNLSDIHQPGITLNNSDHGVGVDNGNYILTMDGDGGRYLFAGDGKTLERLPVTHLDRNEWTRCDIKSGIPTVVADTQEAFVPQMANLDLIDAVNFKKGCYPGQEVVARVRYLGKIKQRMYLATSPLENLVMPGEKIYAADDDEKAVGTVVQSARDDSGQVIQVVLQTAAVDEHRDLRVGSADGEKLMVGNQPYRIEE